MSPGSTPYGIVACRYVAVGRCVDALTEAVWPGKVATSKKSVSISLTENSTNSFPFLISVQLQLPLLTTGSNSVQEKETGG